MTSSFLSATVLVFNELMAANVGNVMSPACNFDSWVEIYNPNDYGIDIGGMYLSDNPITPMLWKMPDDMGIVPANGYKVVWLGSNDIKANQAPFKLDCDGGIICLSDTNRQIVTTETYPKAMSRTAWARKTDGTGEWGWTADASPGTSNTGAVFASQRLTPPKVSIGSKLFTESLSFQVDIPEGARLMYTTDGSMPKAAAEQQDTVIKESLDGQFTVTETTNYCFRLFQEDMLPSIPVTRSFIKTDNLFTLPIISIVGDRNYFTDPKTGIDCDGDGTNGAIGNGQTEPKNYNQPWDRPVNFSYISPDGEMLFNHDVNISVSGGYTRAHLFRSFKLKSNKVFDGQNRFEFPFFPQKPYIRNKTLLVRNGGNDFYNNNARFVDPALNTIIQRSGIDLDVQSYVPIIEYINGELRGVLNLREPSNDKFAYANWGYDDEELDDFENFTMKNGTDEVINRIIELAAAINREGAYDELKTLLDIDEFTNYMASNIYIFNDDWPYNNIKAYRSRNNGRYRFVSCDLDHAFARHFADSGEDPFAFFSKFSKYKLGRLFYNLLEHDDFRRKFIDTFCLVAGSVFEPSRAGAIVDELLNNVNDMCQLMVQKGLTRGHTPDRAADAIKNELENRSDKLTNCMQQFAPMRLSNATRQSVMLNTDTKGAAILVNGIPVPSGHAPKVNDLWSMFAGHLFHPITLCAEPPAGYEFAGWKNGNDIIATNKEINLPTDSVINLTASFIPLKEQIPIRINEVSADNGIYVNEFFKRNDWVELYNTTSEPIDVAGMYLSDAPDNPQKYQIQPSVHNDESTIIPAHGYLIVWCDKLVSESQIHAPFKLAAEGGDVLLTAADGSWSDLLTYKAMKADETVGRYPDGDERVYLMNLPTIARPNMTSSYVVPVKSSVTTNIFTVAKAERQTKDTDVWYTLSGYRLNGIRTLPKGIYIHNGQKVVVK